MSAVPVPAKRLLEAITDLEITEVVTVPDTHQQTLLALLAHSRSPQLVTACTEDEAIAIHAGLYCGGRRPLLLVQNNGIYAGLNAIKGIAMEARIPTCLLVGEHARDPNKASVANPRLWVRMLEPTLETWSVPFLRIEEPAHVDRLAEGHALAYDRRGPVAVLVGAPPC